MRFAVAQKLFRQNRAKLTGAYYRNIYFMVISVFIRVFVFIHKSIYKPRGKRHQSKKRAYQKNMRNVCIKICQIHDRNSQYTGEKIGNHNIKISRSACISPYVGICPEKQSHQGGNYSKNTGTYYKFHRIIDNGIFGKQTNYIISGR